MIEVFKSSKKSHRSWRGSDDAILNTADVAILVISGPRGGACGIAYVNGYQVSAINE